MVFSADTGKLRNSFKYIMFKHKDITLRLPALADLELMRRLRNDPSTWEHLTDPNLVTEAGQRRWFESLSSRPDRKYFVASNRNHSFIGIVRMDEYDPLNRSIRVGADVSPQLRGRGLGNKVFTAILAYCFDELNVHRAWLAVLETNVVARKLYAKQGFHVEGKYRKAVFRHGKYLDYILMSILENEYRR